MYKSALALCIALMAAPAFQPARAEIGAKVQAPKVDAETKNFVKEARVAGTFEVASSKLALQKTQNAGIRAFAERMVSDHGKIGQDLDEIAANQNVAVDETLTADKLDKKHQAMLEKLKASSAAEFDKLYVQMQQGAHDGAIKLFTAYVKKGKNDGLRSFAEDTLPALQDHKKSISGLPVS